MNFYKTLPTAARVGIPLMLVLLIGVMAYLTIFKSTDPIVVIKTEDVGVFEAAKTQLARQPVIAYDDKQEGKLFMIEVEAGDTATAAARRLAMSGIKDRTGLAKKINCPAAPGFTATKSANERADNCSNASVVQDMLMAAGADAANVKVSQQENGTLLGPEMSLNVVAQVFLPQHMRGKWNAEQAADAIAGAVGTSLDRVTITDSELQTLFDGSKSKASEGAAASSGLGCNDISGATEIETKKAAVRACYKRTISDELEGILGTTDAFVLTVEPKIDSAARTTTSMRNTQGPVTDRSHQKGEGNDSLDETSPPSTEEETKIDPAGDLVQLRLSVTLDKAAVGADQVLAVKRVLMTHTETKRGDPMPVVTLTNFSGRTGVSKNDTTSMLKEIKAKADANADAGITDPNKPTTAKLPRWMMMLVGIIVLVLLATIALMWRRSTALGEQRRELEKSFERDQRLFENFAQQNPDTLAQDLNALFGAPPARDPAYRS